MNKFLTRTSGLLILSICSATSYASSPWSEENASPIAQQAAEPASDSGIPAPVSATTEEAQPAYMQEERDAAPAAATETSQRQTVRSETRQSGDVLSMPASDQPARVRLLDFPRRGMSTQTVENELGRPNEIEPAVGTPPISRWIYDDRVVFFERTSVVHVVAR
jgi:hypothetical protein